MKDSNEIQSFEDETENILTSSLQGLLQGLTGVATSSKKDLIFSLSHTLQKMRGGAFLTILLKEWNEFRKKGKVKDDYQFTEQHKVCLQELLNFLDNDSPDEIRFTILKKIFLVASTEEVSNRNSVLPQQFMKIARNITDGEIIILSSIFKILKENTWQNEKYHSASNWLITIAEESGLKYKSLVEIHEQELIKKNLLSPRTHSDKSGILVQPHYRLTDLGFDICNFIENYEEE